MDVIPTLIKQNEKIKSFCFKNTINYHDCNRFPSPYNNNNNKFVSRFYRGRQNFMIQVGINFFLIKWLEQRCIES